MSKKIIVDKIFDNNYKSTEINEITDKINIHEDFVDSYDIDIDLEDVEDIVYEYIKTHEKYSKYVFDDDFRRNKRVKIKKYEVLDVYFTLSKKIHSNHRIEMFNAICELLDISYNRLYLFLPNVAKEDLIKNLNIRGYEMKIKNLFT